MKCFTNDSIKVRLNPDVQIPRLVILKLFISFSYSILKSMTFIERYRLPKLTKEEIENLSRVIISDATELVIKILPSVAHLL